MHSTSTTIKVAHTPFWFPERVSDRGEHRQAAGAVTKVIISPINCATLDARGNGQETTMRNPVLSIAIALALTAPCTAFAGDKGKQRNIEVNDYGFGVSMPVTTSRSDGGGATIGPAVSPTTKAPIGGSTGPTKPTLPTTSGQHR
jgi:hypothetical protein